MNDLSSRKVPPQSAGSENSADAEINRKLTAHILDNAIAADASDARPLPAAGLAERAVGAPRLHRSFFGQFAALSGLVVLLGVASLYSYLYDREAS